MKPIVSIIIPVYNRPVEFERALLSAIAQNYENIEIIVVDDGSIEDIKSIVTRNSSRSRFPITYIWQENKGPGGARQTGIEQANGKYIQYLDADDTISPDKISKQVNSLEANPFAVACICVKPGKKFSNDLLELALNASPWPTSAPLWKYPNKDVEIWPLFIGGEDIVHYVIVGIHFREIIWYEEELIQIYDSNSSHSKMSRQGASRERRLKDNEAFPIYMYELLKNSGLINNKKYSEPLAERLYRIAFQFAMIGRKDSALNLLNYSYKTTKLIRKKLEILIAHFLLIITDCQIPSLYILLFKIHRKINPKSLHADKYITLLTH